MKYTIRENKQYSWSDLFKGLSSIEGKILEDVYEHIIYTGNGRAALRIILDYLKTQGKINNKNSEVLISQWVCLSVYNTMHKVCFPSLAPTKNTKGIIIYHQYGFPQNMDEILPIAAENNWFLIENCVNVFESYYKGRKLGTFGLASIFSLSKMFPSVQGGALVTSNADLLNYANNSLQKGHSDFISFMANLSRVLSEKGESAFWTKIQEMVYTRIESVKEISSLALHLARKEMLQHAMQQRQRNYHFLLDYFKHTDLFQNLERDVIPFVVPLHAKEEIMLKIKNAFLSSGIWTDLYHFDVNRNMLNPDFKRSVWIPIHQGINQQEMEGICELIRKQL